MKMECLVSADFIFYHFLSSFQGYNSLGVSGCLPLSKTIVPAKPSQVSIVSSMVVLRQYAIHWCLICDLQSPIPHRHSF